MRVRESQVSIAGDGGLKSRDICRWWIIATTNELR
jgi:hypothetical protein